MATTTVISPTLSVTTEGDPTKNPRAAALVERAKQQAASGQPVQSNQSITAAPVISSTMTGKEKIVAARKAGTTVPGAETTTQERAKILETRPQTQADATAAMEAQQAQTAKQAQPTQQPVVTPTAPEAPAAAVSQDQQKYLQELRQVQQEMAKVQEENKKLAQQQENLRITEEAKKITSDIRAALGVSESTATTALQQAQSEGLAGEQALARAKQLASQTTEATQVAQEATAETKQAVSDIASQDALFQELLKSESTLPSEWSYKQLSDYLLSEKANIANMEAQQVRELATLAISAYKTSYESTIKSLSDQKSIDESRLDAQYDYTVAESDRLKASLEAEKASALAVQTQKLANFEGFAKASLEAMGIPPESTAGISIMNREMQTALLNAAVVANKYNDPLVSLVNNTANTLRNLTLDIAQVQNNYIKDSSATTLEYQKNMIGIQEKVYASETKRKEDLMSATADWFNSDIQLKQARESRVQAKVTAWQTQQKEALKMAFDTWKEKMSKEGYAIDFDPKTGKMEYLKDADGNLILTVDSRVDLMEQERKMAKDERELYEVDTELSQSLGVFVNKYGEVIGHLQGIPVPQEAAGIKSVVELPNGVIAIVKEDGTISYSSGFQNGNGQVMQSGNTIQDRNGNQFGIFSDGTGLSIQPGQPVNLQCGEFVNDIAFGGERKMGDTLASKLAHTDPNRKPQVGDIFVYPLLKPGEEGDTGHTGIVSRVYPNGDIEVSQTNANPASAPGEFSTDVITKSRQQALGMKFGASNLSGRAESISRVNALDQIRASSTRGKLSVAGLKEINQAMLLPDKFAPLIDALEEFSDEDMGFTQGRISKLTPNKTQKLDAARGGLMATVSKGIYGETGVLSDQDIERMQKVVPDITNDKLASYQNSLMLLDIMESSLASGMKTAATTYNVSEMEGDYLVALQKIQSMKNRIAQLANDERAKTLTGGISDRAEVEGL